MAIKKVTGYRRASAAVLVPLALVVAVLLPLAAQTLAIETLHLPDAHSQQSHRAPGWTTASDAGLVAVTSGMPVSAINTQDIAPPQSHRPAPRPVEPPEYPPR